MRKIVITDTSVLILFEKIESLRILEQVYTELLTTPEIQYEYGKELPNFIEVVTVSDKKYQDLLEIYLDKGEASAIALANQFDNSLLLLDDLKARKIAIEIGFQITGTLGIVTKAKSLGFIENVKPIIDKLIKADFRISQKIIEEVLRLNGE